jgi:hypothetical protein
MATKIHRFPSGFVLVERNVKSIATVEDQALVDSELKNLYQEVLASKTDPEGKTLLNVALVVRKYLGVDVRQWVRDQIEYAQLDSIRWGFFVDFCRILTGEDRSLVSWRNVIGRAIVGDVADFLSYSSARDRNKRQDEQRISTYVNVDNMWSSDNTSDLIVRFGSTESAVFFLYILYGQNAEFLENIRNNRVTHWLPTFRQK